jgi:hypothetical protein
MVLVLVWFGFCYYFVMKTQFFLVQAEKKLKYNDLTDYVWFLFWFEVLLLFCRENSIFSAS